MYGPQDSRVVRQPSNGDPDVVVNSEHLLLVRGELSS